MKKREWKWLRRGMTLLCLLALLVSLVQPVEAKKFNKTEAKKKVTVTYKRLSDGVLATYKNKNNTNLKITATMHFLNGSGKDITKDTQTNLCVQKKSTAAFFFPAPRDEYGQVVNYTSYKGSFSVAKSSKKSYTKNIKVSYELTGIEGKFAAVNIGDKTLKDIHATIVFYDDSGDIVLCRTKSMNCFKKNAIDQFGIEYMGMTKPSKAKVYIDWAY